MAVDENEVRQFAIVGLTNPALSQIVSEHTLLMSDSDEKTCAACAGYLYACGFLDGQVLVCGAQSPRQQKQLIRKLRDEAVNECRSVGILPDFGLTWLLIRYIVLPFLTQLFLRWIENAAEPNRR